MPFGEYYKRLARIAEVPAPLMTMPKQTSGLLGLFPKWNDVGGTLGLDISRQDLLWQVTGIVIVAKLVQLLWVPRDPLTTLSDTVHDIKKEEQYNP